MSDRIYPFLSKDGKLYEQFPTIILALNDGSEEHVNYFFRYQEHYMPTRYMEPLKEGELIPEVKYLSKFISPDQVLRDFFYRAKREMSNNDMPGIKVNQKKFIFWSNITSVEVDMKGFIVEYSDIKWGKKECWTTSTPRILTEEEVKELGVLDEKKPEEKEKETTIDKRLIVDDFINLMILNNNSQNA